MNLQKYRNLIIISIFAVSLTAPLVAMVLNLDRSPLLRENRERAPFPAIAFNRHTLRKFPHDFYTYFRDNFGLRDAFIRIDFIVRRMVLKEREFNEVLFGENGWLFYLGEREMDDLRGITHYDDETLAAWTASLERKRQWLATRGIRYLFVIAPNKETIYGENLPAPFRKLRDRTGLDEFVEYVRTHSGVEVLDLKHVLLAAKNQMRIYDKTGTHWNEYGAFIAYQEIMKTISGWLPVKPSETLSDYVIERKPGDGRELALLVGGAEFLKEEDVYLVPVRARQARETEITGDGKIITMCRDDMKLPRVLVFRDSFFDALIPFITEQFQYARYYRHHWDDSIPIASVVETV